MRQMAAVIFRMCVNKDAWTAAGQEAQTVVKAGLLEAVFLEPVQLVRKALADVISKLAAVSSQAGETRCRVSLPCFFVLFRFFLFALSIPNGWSSVHRSCCPRELTDT